MLLTGTPGIAHPCRRWGIGTVYPRMIVTFLRSPCSLGSNEFHSNMKNSTLLFTAFLATFVAIIVLPVGIAAAAIAFTATGLLSVLVADYGRNLAPVRAAAEIVPFGAPGTKAALRRAA